jgi:hypothetical protein
MCSSFLVSDTAELKTMAAHDLVTHVMAELERVVPGVGLGLKMTLRWLARDGVASPCGDCSPE